MDFDEFRRHGHAFVDWMADYLETVEDRPVRPQVEPGEIARQLPSSPPDSPEAMADIFADFENILLPGMVNWQHPSFFAFFTANSSPPSVLAEMLTATLGAQCMMWETSPAATELETRVLDWLRQMCGLPGPDEGGFHGVIQDTASSAILCAILTARERATDWAANVKGLKSTPPLAVYTSIETHSSTEKSVKIAGLGADALRKIATTDDFGMDPKALRAAVEADIAAGIIPACVIASIGATGVGAVDPLEPIGQLCREHGIFLHIDSAWAGSAFILPEKHWMLEGIDYADSLVLNPHKWLFTNFDCSAHYVRDPDALIRTLTILPDYLKHANQGDVIDYRDWGIALGRRFRALKLWFVIRSYGVSGLQSMLRAHIAHTVWLTQEIEDDKGFTLAAPRRLSLIAFRYVAGNVEPEEEDRRTDLLAKTLNDSGRLYVTPTTVKGRRAIRFNIGQTYTERHHVEAAWKDIKETAAALFAD